MWENILAFLKDALIWIGVVVGALTVYLVTESIMDSKTMKTWKKTAWFLLLSEAFTAFIGWMSWNSYQSGNRPGGILCGIADAAMAIGFALGAVYGHKRGWKRDTR